MVFKDGKIKNISAAGVIETSVHGVLHDGACGEFKLQPRLNGCNTEEMFCDASCTALYLEESLSGFGDVNCKDDG